VRRHRTQPAAANNSRSDTETGEYLPRAFAEIELLAAIDVIESVISVGRRHVDFEALEVYRRRNHLHQSTEHGRLVNPSEGLLKWADR
jgi:hypothetical protein